MELPWIQGPIGETEASAINAIYPAAGVDDRRLREKFMSSPWLRDGISQTELTALYGLMWLSIKDTSGAGESSDWRPNDEALRKVISLPWVQDDITKTEADILLRIGKLSFQKHDIMSTVLDMPFLRTPNDTDRMAVSALRSLTVKDMASEVLNHPQFRGGITDENTILFAAAAFVRGIEETRRMLEPGYAEVETLSRGTKLTPGMKISIVRTETKSHPKTIEGAWKAIEFVESMMQMPLPTDHPLILLNSKAVPEYASGLGGQFSIKYIPHDEHSDFTREILLLGLSHEVTHYYWGGVSGGKTKWVNEGIAETLKYMYAAEMGIRDGIPPRPPTGPGNCKADDLERYEKREYQRPIGALNNCPYYLGASLFLELLEELGTDEFNRRIQELHPVYEAARNVGGHPTAEAYKYTDIHGLRQVFHDQLEIVERHWSGRMNAPENRP